jgi:hypothetical protein
MTSTPSADRRVVVLGLAAASSLLPPGHANAGASGPDSSLADQMADIEDRAAIEQLQYEFGYRLDAGDWTGAADLFTSTGELEFDGQGVYRGRDRITRFLALRAAGAPAYGKFWVTLQMQPLVTLAPDGRTAWARFRGLEMRGELHVNARWGEGVYENRYARDSGGWRYSRMQFFRTFLAEVKGGWAGAALPLAGEDKAFPPDQPPSRRYDSYPGVDIPPFHELQDLLRD